MKFPKSFKHIILFVALILMSRTANADSICFHNNFRFIEIIGQAGGHIYSADALKEASPSKYKEYRTLQLRYGWNSSDPDGWQSMYLYPQYGIGWYSGSIGDPEIVGRPSAVYGFISFPLSYDPKHYPFIEASMGVGYHFKPYHKEHNYQNDAIGSKITGYLNLKLAANYRLNRELDLIYGFDIIHFSNGRIYKPNAGLNMLGINVGLRYNFNTMQKEVDNSCHPKVVLDARPQHNIFRPKESIKRSEFLLYSAFGLVQNDMDNSKHYGTFSTCIEYRYLINTCSGVTAGFDFFYDSSLKPFYPDESYDLYGAHIGYDFLFWKFAARLQGGTYLTQKGRNFKGHFFFRPALQYNIGSKFYAQIGLKTHKFKADWVEWGIGVKFPC